ncbi:MAG: hypothetical protein ACOH2N_00525 [Devosia sp.]
MYRPMTDHQLKLKRVDLFSAASRRLRASEEFADDTWGVHEEANRIADRQMAEFLADQEALDPANIARAVAKSEAERKAAAAVVAALGGIDKLLGRSTESAAPTTPAEEPDAFSWDDIFTNNNSNR